MDAKRQTTRPQPDRHALRDGEAVAAGALEHEASLSSNEAIGPTEQLAPLTMEVVLDKTNLQTALSRVMANKGAAGIDGMTVDQLPDFLWASWPTIRQQLLNGHYKPQPVKRVYIPKPDGGERALGIPTVLDRFIQQALLGALSPRWEPTFSDHSFGFRPGRSAHQAVERAQGYITEGHAWVVDIDRGGLALPPGEILRSGQPRHAHGPGDEANQRRSDREVDPLVSERGRDGERLGEQQ